VIYNGDHTDLICLISCAYSSYMPSADSAITAIYLSVTGIQIKL